ncbi:cell division protein FtsZ [Patescibacteria group bacterium]
MQVQPEIESFAKIKVIGVGGSGGAAVNRMQEVGVKGVEFIAINTDAQALHHNNADQKIHIGKTLTRGLGAGMNPDVGKAAAEENQDEIIDAIKGADMVFLTCGLGGGTGSGATPIIADLAREHGALTVAFVTKPFDFEGAQRRQIALSSFDELVGRVDTLLSIPNDRIFQIIDKKTSMIEAFGAVDDVMRQGVQGIAELITAPGLVNVDFADVKAVMKDAGSALMGIGTSTGEERAAAAAKQAIESPLLELSINGAKGILFNVVSGPDLGMYEIDQAAKVITESADANAKVIFGATIDESMGEEMRITVVATGFEGSGNATTNSVSSFMSSPTEKSSPVTIGSSAPKTMQRGSVNLGGQPKPEVLKTNEVIADDVPEVAEPKQESDELDIPAFIRRKMKQK